MSLGPMIYYGDLIRAFSVCKSDEEREAMAKAMGFEKKDEQNEQNDCSKEKGVDEDDN